MTTERITGALNALKQRCMTIAFIVGLLAGIITLILKIYNMQINGELKVIFDAQTVSDRFKKREFVLTTETNTPYPQHLIIQLTQDKCDILNSYNEGDEVRVDFNLRGREWNGPQGVKYFNTIEAWRLSLVNKGANPIASASNTTVSSAPPQSDSNDNDNLPF